MVEEHDEAIGADILHEALAVGRAHLVVLLEGHSLAPTSFPRM